MKISNLDTFVEDHLNLQVKISYKDHHDFLVRHGLNECKRILDLGCGNGSFVSRLASDHLDTQFVGIDKRKQCIDSAKKFASTNLEFSQVDMFSTKSDFDFTLFDGFLMRYFLLHVDNAHKILNFIKNQTQENSKIWIIDLDWSSFKCIPEHPSFEKMLNIVKKFCSKVSVDTQGGQNILPLIERLGFKNIILEKIPFSSKNISIDDFVKYLQQEIICYTLMCGNKMDEDDVVEVLSFISNNIRNGQVDLLYGVSLLSATT